MTMNENTQPFENISEPHNLDFQDLAKLDDHIVQLVIADIDTGVPATALSGANSVIVEKVLVNMSERVSGMLRDEIESAQEASSDRAVEARNQLVDAKRTCCLTESGGENRQGTESGNCHNAKVLFLTR